MEGQHLSYLKGLGEEDYTLPETLPADLDEKLAAAQQNLAALHVLGANLDTLIGSPVEPENQE